MIIREKSKTKFLKNTSSECWLQVYLLFQWEKTSGTKDHVGDTIVKIADLQQEIAKDISEMSDIQQEVSSTINSLDNSLYSQLLHKKYVEYKSLVTVADEMGYSIQHIRSCHLKAIESVRKVKGFKR